MNWYDKLNQYFPVEEMKSREHMELLLQEKRAVYKKDEGKYHVMMYADMEDFIFVDYLFVSKEARGKGVGKQLLDKLKQRGKPIILEVEPIDYKDTDTQKRLRFYQREGFQHAKSIGYRRRSLETGEINELEILYWSPANESEVSIYNKMRHTYETIHTYKDLEVYGERYEPTEKVLSFNQEHP
ncbi:Acetyltransferase (GNAT) domain-containing protein [Evansella caseinilytica]|uniref:Acetyltransferase (GNAT) domain-containing protein n=1 Tax=Evansella caseinilytica TaxID=1503961 RepID=A0A1H3PHS8_9BACI|nr:GNAT family N-acetyltransferase [Evansella caseinilytica]SDZ00660.1 Acetyltransferase (GNAT) domain-containing protein [Evansella caseinilytica]